MSNTYHTPIATGAGANAAIINDPLGDLDAQLGVVTNEVVAGRGGQASLDARFDAVEGEIVSGRGGNGSLGTRFDIAEADISALEGEVTAGRGGYANLDARMDAETAARATAVSSEAAARAAADIAEAAARISGDNALDDRIDNLILTSGDSSPEVADARLAGNTDGSSVDTLRERIALAAAGAYHPMAYGATGNGATDDRAALNTLANTTIGLAGGTLVIDRPYAINSNITFPELVTLRFVRGGRLVIPTGVTVTINGPIEAGRHAIFSLTGTGTVTLGPESNGTVRPEWFGARVGSAYNCTPGIQAAVNALQARGGRILLSKGDYYLQGTVYLYNAIEISGRARESSRVLVAHTYSGPIFEAAAARSWLRMSNLTVRAPGVPQAADDTAPAAIFFSSPAGQLRESHFDNLHLAGIGTGWKGSFQDCKWTNIKCVRLTTAGYWFTGFALRLGNVRDVDLEGNAAYAPLGFRCDEGIFCEELHLSGVKYEAIKHGVFRSIGLIVERSPSYGPSAIPPFVGESVGAYITDPVAFPQGYVPVMLSDIDLPNYVNDGDMGLSGTAAWTRSGANPTWTSSLAKVTTFTQDSDRYITLVDRKHSKVMQVTNTHTDGTPGAYVEQSFTRPSGVTNFFFTCLYAILPANPAAALTIEVRDNTGLLWRRANITGTTYERDAFRRLSGIFTSSGTTITVRFIAVTEDMVFWLNEVVVAPNLVSQAGYALQGSGGTIDTASTADYYTEPSSIRLDRSSGVVTYRHLISLLSGNRTYLLHVRAKAVANGPTLRVGMLTAIDGVSAQYMEWRPNVDGWVEGAALLSGDSIGDAYQFLRLSGTNGTVYIDSIALVDLGSKMGYTAHPTYEPGGRRRPYLRIEGPELTLNNGSITSTMLLAPSEFYQLHKVEMVFTNASSAGQDALVKVGTGADDDAYVSYNTNGTRATGTVAAATPLRSDVRPGEPLYLTWSNHVNQTAKVKPILYLR